MNVKEELLLHIQDRNITYISIHVDARKIEGTLAEVLPLVEDIDYNAGYGIQHVVGHIWYTDGTWSGRAEYDGSECWVHRSRPPCVIDRPIKCVSPVTTDLEVLQYIYDLLLADQHYSYYQHMARLWCIIDAMKRGIAK